MSSAKWQGYDVLELIDARYRIRWAIKGGAKDTRNLSAALAINAAPYVS